MRRRAARARAAAAAAAAPRRLLSITRDGDGQRDDRSMHDRCAPTANLYACILDPEAHSNYYSTDA
jgi:hypothetical protein